MIDQKHGMVLSHLLVLDHDHVAIVQHKPVSIEPCGNNSVVLFPNVVSQDDDPKVVSGNSRLLQSNELRDRVVFAVPSSYSECGQGRAPDIVRTVKCQIALWLYLQIDCAVDLTESSAPSQGSCTVNNG